MYYNVTFNYRNIRKIGSHCKLHYEQIGPILKLDREHFDEKDNWYRVDNLLQYFKQRNDSRIFGELLSDEILKLHGFQTAQYQVVSLDDNIGLLSPNIQKEGYRYESVATLKRLFPAFSDPFYSDSRKVTIKKIIDFLKQNNPDSEVLIEEIIRKYIIDWFTSQLDYNIRNMTFEISPEGIIRLAPIIDSESAFGATKKGINLQSENIWIPAIPANDPTFKTGPYKEDNFDANILFLLFEYPEIVYGILTEFVNTNYNGLLNKYKQSNNTFSAMTLPDKAISHLDQYFYERQEESEEMRNIIR